MGVGLQTSVVIHEHFRPDQEDPRSRRRVLVRIVDASDPQTRDRIIRSTNSQTAVPTALTSCTNVVQRRHHLCIVQGEARKRAGRGSTEGQHEPQIGANNERTAEAP